QADSVPVAVIVRLARVQLLVHTPAGPHRLYREPRIHRPGIAPRSTAAAVPALQSVSGARRPLPHDVFAARARARNGRVPRRNWARSPTRARRSVRRATTRRL